MSYAVTVLADSPRNYWPMLDDLSDLGHTPTPLTARFTDVQDLADPGTGGLARRPSGTQLAYRPTTQFNINTSAWSMEVWYMRRGSFTDSAMIGTWGSNAGAMLYIGGTAPGTVSGYARSSNNSTGLTPALNTWEHWVYTFDTATDRRRVYRNGVMVLDVLDTVNGVFDSSRWGLGQYNLVDGTSGNHAMCHAAVWLDRALTPERVAAHYTAMVGTPPAGGYALQFEISPDATSTGGSGHRARSRVQLGPVGGALTNIGSFPSDPESGDDGVREWTPWSVYVGDIFDPGQDFVVEFESDGGVADIQDRSYLRRVRIVDDTGTLWRAAEYPRGAPYTDDELDGIGLGGDDFIGSDGGVLGSNSGGADPNVWNTCSKQLETLTGEVRILWYFSVDPTGCSRRRPVVGFIGFR